MALPYYARDGALVDMRFLHIDSGRLLGSWLAAEAAAPFLNAAELSRARQVVFVDRELDALLLSSQGVPAIALPPQAPQWPTNADAAGGAQAQAVQQQQQQGVSQQQQQQQQRPEDPRLRLTQLSADLAQARREYDVGVKRAAVTGGGAAARAKIAPSSDSSSNGSTGASSGSASSLLSSWGEGSGASSSSSTPEGYLVSDVGMATSSMSGLQLLLKLPAADKDCHAVIALQASAGGGGGAAGGSAAAAAEELAELLDKVMCRQVQWPFDVAASPEAYEQQQQAVLAAAAAAAASPGSSHGSPTNAAGDDGGSPTLLPPPRPPSAAAVEAAQAAVAACGALRHMLGDGAMCDWSLLSVSLLLAGAAAVQRALSSAYVWPISGLERFADYTLDILHYWDTTNMATLAHSSGWPSLDAYYKVGGSARVRVPGAPCSCSCASNLATTTGPTTRPGQPGRGHAGHGRAQQRQERVAGRASRQPGGAAGLAFCGVQHGEAAARPRAPAAGEARAQAAAARRVRRGRRAHERAGAPRPGSEPAWPRVLAAAAAAPCARPHCCLRRPADTPRPVACHAH
jgi:hypothetical protein